MGILGTVSGSILSRLRKFLGSILGKVLGIILGAVFCWHGFGDVGKVVLNRLWVVSERAFGQTWADFEAEFSAGLL